MMRRVNALSLAVGVLALVAASPAPSVPPAPPPTPSPPPRYVEAKGLGAAAAARILNAQYTTPGTVRVSYTDRDGHQAQLVAHPSNGADAFGGDGYPATGFYAVPGEKNPLFRVTVNAIGGRNLQLEDIYVIERHGALTRVPVYQVNVYDSTAKPISPEQRFAQPVRTLHFKRYIDVVGGGSDEGFAQYFVRLSDGKPAILQTDWILQDKSYDSSSHLSMPQPEPVVAGTCYRLYVYGSTAPFFAVCPAKAYSR